MMITIIKLLHVYDKHPLTRRPRDRCSLWIYPGELDFSDDDVDGDDCGADMGCWVQKHAVELQGTWRNDEHLGEEIERITHILRLSGHEVEVEMLADD